MKRMMMMMAITHSLPIRIMRWNERERMWKRERNKMRRRRITRDEREE